MTRATRFILLPTLIGLMTLVILLTGCGGGSLKLTNLSAIQLFDLGMEKYRSEKYREAVQCFQTVIYDYPGESMVDTAQYYLALSYYGDEDYVLARVEFNRLITYYPASAFLSNSVFLKAVCFYESTPDNPGLDQSDLNEAIKQFEDFIIDFPESEMIEQAQEYLNRARGRLAKKDYQAALVYLRMRALESAEIYFQRVIDNYTRTDYAAMSLFMLGKIKEEMKKYDEASLQYNNFTQVYPNHEWVEKATKKAVEMAFKAAEQAYENNQLTDAREKFRKFLEQHPGDKRADKAGEYLEKIGDIPDEEAQSESTGS